jgi:hypothetical protein
MAQVNATSVFVGANVTINTTAILVGNATTNAVLSQTSLAVGNSVVNVFANSTNLRLGNTTVNTVISSTDIKSGGTLTVTGNTTLSTDVTLAIVANTNLGTNVSLPRELLNFPLATYTGAKITASIKTLDGANTQTQELILAQNTIDSVITVYGTVASPAGANLGVFSSSINTTAVALNFLQTSANSSVKLFVQFIK